MQLTSTILFINPHIYIYPYINITLNIYLTNQIFEQLLTLLFFFPSITNINYTQCLIVV